MSTIVVVLDRHALNSQFGMLGRASCFPRGRAEMSSYHHWPSSATALMWWWAGIQPAAFRTRPASCWSHEPRAEGTAGATMGRAWSSCHRSVNTEVQLMKQNETFWVTILLCAISATANVFHNNYPALLHCIQSLQCVWDMLVKALEILNAGVENSS